MHELEWGVEANREFLPMLKDRFKGDRKERAKILIACGDGGERSALAFKKMADLGYKAREQQRKPPRKTEMRLETCSWKTGRSPASAPSAALTASLIVSLRSCATAGQGHPRRLRRLHCGAGASFSALLC